MKAIKSIKSGKAAGIDGIQAELLKVDIHTATVTLHGLFKDIWEENKIPEDWAKGLIVKLPKKGDPIVGSGLFSTALKCSTQRVACSLSVKRMLPLLSLTGGDCPHGSFVIL
jgi:hypothetical protein